MARAGLGHPAGLGRRGGSDAGADQEVGLPTQGGLGPSRRLLVAAEEKVAPGGRHLHGEGLGILRAEAHGARGLLDRRLGLAEERLGERAEVPDPGEVLVQRERLVEQGGTLVELAGDDDQGHAGIGQRHRVVAGRARRRAARAAGSRRSPRRGRPPSRSPCAAGSSARAMA